MAEGRQGHAYLFSGPRGTGKTSTARVLAKALNCENLDNGEPCTECKSCRDIEAGRSFDLHELDAASNNKVENMRDLIEKVSLGSPGRTKVYILDEVHMLSTGAENALLKTLEEPPDHVVFVLATTEPHKVVPTIRSRTQHFEFHLLPGEELAEHVRWVAEDAGLNVDDDAIEYALRQGGGSARDTLSALDLVVAAGGVPDTSNAGLELVTAIGKADAGAAMAAVQHALETGREARTIGEEALDVLRDAFLTSMGAPPEQLNERARAEAAELAQLLSPAAITRSLEQLGEALVEMRQAPDPRVPLEVAVLRLARGSGDDLSALLQRIERLESQLAQFASQPPAARADSPVSAPAVQDEPATRTPPPAQVDARAPAPPTPTTPLVNPTPPPPPITPRNDADESAPSAKTAPSEAPSPEPSTRTSPPADAAGPAAAPRPAGNAAAPLRLDELNSAFDGGLLDEFPQRVRARYRLGHFVAVTDNVADFVVPNATVIPRCEEVRPDVESALAARFGHPVQIRLIVENSSPSASDDEPVATNPTSPQAAAEHPTQPARAEVEEVDIDSLEDADGQDATGIDRLTQAFPGSTVIESPVD